MGVVLMRRLATEHRADEQSVTFNFLGASDVSECVLAMARTDDFEFDKPYVDAVDLEVVYEFVVADTASPLGSIDVRT